MNPLPNRIAVYLTAAAALVAGLLPLVGNLDWQSTAGVLAGLGAILGVVVKWLDGWSKYERGEGPGILPGDDELETLDDYAELEDGFDEANAEPIPPAVAQAAHTPEPEAATRLATDDELEGGTPATGSPPIPPGPRPERARRPPDTRP